VISRTDDLEGSMLADLDLLLIAVFCTACRQRLTSDPPPTVEI
jgi:hypothetical protein